MVRVDDRIDQTSREGVADGNARERNPLSHGECPEDITHGAAFDLLILLIFRTYPINKEEASMPSVPPLVTTVEGPVQGSTDGGVYVFQGIPYAKPPVKNLRWRPPQAVDRWTKPLIATNRGAACFQDADLCTKIGGGNPEPPPLSEDCLYLKVWTPDLTTTADLPVMVWIHGGGFTIGAGALPPYVGTPLAKREAVVVTINYRLGHLGFFAHPALDKEYPSGEVVNNFALLDQIAALEWVQRNIDKFGGDSSNVTIFGQSAGGRSVLSLFASPRARGLFHKGAAQSVYGLPDIPREAALLRGVAVAKYFGKDGAVDVAAELRKVDPNLFWQIDAKEAPAAAFGGPVPISGDSVLREPLLQVFEKEEQALLPLIIGNTSDDSSVLSEFGFGPEDVIAILKQNEELYSLIKGLYGVTMPEEELGRQVGRDLLFTTMTFIIARDHYNAGVPSWRYYFDYVAENARKDQPNGAQHGGEVSFVMDTIDIAPPPGLTPTEEDKDFAEVVSEYWLEFARHASDSSEIIPGAILWPKHRPGELFDPNKTMGFGKDLGPELHLINNIIWLKLNIWKDVLPILGEMMSQLSLRTHSLQRQRKTVPAAKSA